MCEFSLVYFLSSQLSIIFFLPIIAQKHKICTLIHIFFFSYFELFSILHCTFTSGSLSFFLSIVFFLCRSIGHLLICLSNTLFKHFDQIDLIVSLSFHFSSSWYQINVLTSTLCIRAFSFSLSFNSLLIMSPFVQCIGRFHRMWPASILIICYSKRLIHCFVLDSVL